MRVPHVSADPAEVLGVFGGRHAELLARIGDVVVVLGEVRVQRDTAFARQFGRQPHQVARNRKGRARCQHDAAHRVARSVMPAADEPFAVTQDGVFGLDHFVRRQAAEALAHAHAAARRVKAHAHRIGRLDGVVEPRAVREEVEMVAGRCAAREHELGHRGLCRHTDHLGRDARPRLI